MIENTIRLYQDGRFTSIPAPDWFEEAVSISSTEKLDWHRALSRALDAEHQGLTMEPTGPVGIEISFWASAQPGTYVEIETELGPVEQMLIPRPADWLPFMSAHLTPLLAAVGHVATAAQMERIANALIAFGRHEHGEHIDRSTGRSRIDETRDAGRGVPGWAAREGRQVSGPSATRFTPRDYGGERRGPDQVKREGWREQGVLAVAIDDERLSWPERELVRQLGERLYGKREARHG